MKLPKDYIVLDTETTGLSYRTCKMIELSAIKVRNDEIVDTFSVLVNPHEKVHYFITQLTGISNEMLENEKSIEDVLIPFIDFVEDDVIIGHNILFDIKFINEATTKCLGMIFDNKYIDTMSLSKRLWPFERCHRLEDLIERCDLEGTQEHRGLSDCMYTYKAYLYMKNKLERK